MEAQMNDAPDHIFKLLLLGDQGVGKTSLILQYTDGVFVDNPVSTIGVDFKVKPVYLESKFIKLQLWDTAGRPDCKLESGYYRGSHGILLLYDITNRSSFDSLTRWIEETKNHSTNNNFLLVGTKNDLEDQREVETETAEALSEHLNIPFFEISSKLSVNVELVFLFMTNTILNRSSGSKILSLSNCSALNLPPKNFNKTTSNAFIHVGIPPPDFKYSNPPSFSKKRFSSASSSEVEMSTDPEWRNFQPRLLCGCEALLVRVEIWHAHRVRGKSLIGYSDFRLDELEDHHGIITLPLLCKKGKHLQASLSFEYNIS